MATNKELILQTYFQAANETIYWNKMANTASHEISKQLLGTAVIAIPLIGTIIGNNHMNTILGVVLAFALFFLLVSIVAGIKDLLVVSKFFNDYTQHNANRAKALFKSRNLSLDEALHEAELANKSNTITEQSNNTYSIIQGWCIGIGLLLTSGVIVALVFLS